MDEGTTLYIPRPGASLDSHLWMIISNPSIDPENVLIVNFTEWQSWKDQACVVNVGDHPYITKKICVNYCDAKVVSLKKLLQLEKNCANLRQHAPLSKELLKKIRERVPDSWIKMNHADLLVGQGVIDDF